MDIEELAEKLHGIYQAEARRQESLGIVARHPDDYKLLNENVKEYDRVLARWILTYAAQQVRESLERVRPTDYEAQVVSRIGYKTQEKIDEELKNLGEGSK